MMEIYGRMEGRPELLGKSQIFKRVTSCQNSRCVIALGLAEKSAFACWVPITLKRRDRIIASINSQGRKQTHKFGIDIPKSINDVIKIDRENGNTLW